MSNFPEARQDWEAELARLHTEVERLVSEKNRYAEAAGHSGAVIREREEVLAQVAVLLPFVEQWHAQLHPMRPHCDCAANVLIKNLPAEARVLLDRLRRSEESVGSLIRLIYATDDKSLQREAERRLATLRALPGEYP